MISVMSVKSLAVMFIARVRVIRKGELMRTLIMLMLLGMICTANGVTNHQPIAVIIVNGVQV